MKAVMFLQNAWSPLYAGGTWERRSWLKALKKSRSGLRLREFIERDDIWIDNVTPIVGAFPSSIIPIDVEHVKNILRVHSPEIVIACGKQAELALTGLFEPLIIAPHPTYRVVTNALWGEVVNLIDSHKSGIIKVEQKREGVSISKIQNEPKGSS